MLTTPVQHLLPVSQGAPALVRHRGGPRVIDFFCGMGGSSTGLARAGFDVALAANHWDRAIETHSANHPDTDHWNADLSAYNMTCLPKADVLWASPICTEVSPAGGRKKRTTQMDMFEDLGHVPDAAFERTRITFWEVIRACEVQRFPIVLIENVVEAAKWELFDVWLAGMAALGYEHQFVSVSAAHIGSETNPFAPQWRDRLYIVFNQRGMRRPDVEPRPLAHCFECGEDVQAVQSWKKAHARHIGKYGHRNQYVYVCPNPRRHTDPVVEPYVVPAAAAIDWNNLGIRIGDRHLYGMDDLSPATMRRIQAGLDTIGNPALVAAAGNTYERPGSGYTRAWPVAEAPMMARTGTSTDGLAMTEGAFLSMFRNHGGNTDATHEPLATFSAGGFHHGLTTPPGAWMTMLRGPNNAPTDLAHSPMATLATGNNHYVTTPVPDGAFVSKHHGGLNYKRIEHMNKDPRTQPLPSIVAAANNSLVIPYRKGSKPYGATTGPLTTMATVEAHGVARRAPEAPASVEDCYFRMLTPEEAARAQAFPTDYLIYGNQGERQMQAGNAVATNVSCWLGEAAMVALDAA